MSVIKRSQITRIGKLIILLNAACAVLLILVLGISRRAGGGPLVAYPMNRGCTYGNCAIDIGLLDPNTGQTVAFKVGRIFDTGGLQASTNGQIVYIKTDGIYLISADGENNHRLDVSSVKPNGTLVTIELPYRSET